MAWSTSCDLNVSERRRVVLMICLFLIVNKKKNRKPAEMFFFHRRIAVNRLHLLPAASPCLRISSLPGVYLQHKDGALMMPRACQCNQRAILFICTSCQQTKAYKLQLWCLQHELAPAPKLSLSARRHRDKEAKQKLCQHSLTLTVDRSHCV